MKTAAAKRHMLKSVLVASADTLAQAQAALDADEEVRPQENSLEGVQATAELVSGDLMFEALRACAVAERAAAVAHSLLEKPLTSAWLRSAASDSPEANGDLVTFAEAEERVVEEAQRTAALAEEAAARLTERLGQVRAIRAKLRTMLAAAEARFRRGSAVLDDTGALFDTLGVEEAVQVASTALAHARERLRSPLCSVYLMSSGGGNHGGGLARDEEAVSEATGYVTALESFASSAAETGLRAPYVPVNYRSTERARSSCGELADEEVSMASPSELVVDSPSRTTRQALTLALEWADALQAQVAEQRLGGDSAVAKAIEAADCATSVAKNLWKADNSGGSDASSGTRGRAALEALATELGRLETVVETAAEQRRTRQAGLGAAAKRLDRLRTSLELLSETTQAAGEPMVSLTAEAMRRAADAMSAATALAATAGVEGQPPVASQGGDVSRRPSPLPASPGAVVFVDAVQAAAVTVAQAEATVTWARERASHVSAERVRALETLVGLAEALRAAGDCLASSSVERGLASSREAAASISEAQAALGRARAAAQVDAGAWLSRAAAIAEAVTTAGELVRRAERAADGPAVVRPTTTKDGYKSTCGGTATAVVDAEAKARVWLAGARGNLGDNGQPASSPSIEETARATASTEVKPAEATRSKGARRARIGFSDGGEGAPTYMPLWMRLQKKAWELGSSVVRASGKGGDQAEAECGKTSEDEDRWVE